MGDTIESWFPLLWSRPSHTCFNKFPQQIPTVLIYGHTLGRCCMFQLLKARVVVKYTKGMLHFKYGFYYRSLCNYFSLNAHLQSQYCNVLVSIGFLICSFLLFSSSFCG